jgi:MinD superfamily P-loop ATPase
VIVDGPPGIGCPVIASVTGASLVLVVAEPTVSGEHDVERVLAMARHFGIPVAVCVNKWDLNPEMTMRIENMACDAGATVAGRIRYDHTVTRAQMQELAVVETEASAGRDVLRIWEHLARILDGEPCPAMAVPVEELGRENGVDRTEEDPGNRREQ